MIVELTVEEEDIIAAVVCGLDVVVLSGCVGGVEINDFAVGVSLVGLDEGLVFIEGEVAAFGIAEKEEF